MKIDSRVVACITGGADGMGFELVKLFLSNQATVAIIDFRQDALDSAKTTLHSLGFNPRLVSFHVLDVRDRLQVERIREQVVDAHGRVSVLINCAGVVGNSTFDRLEYEEFDRVLDTNLKGTMNMCKTFFPLLQTENEAYILNMSSIFGLIGMMSGSLAYVTSKFAVTGFTRALQLDLAILAPRIHVASIHPGFVATNMTRNNEVHIDAKSTVGGLDLGDRVMSMLTKERLHSLQRDTASTSAAAAAQQIVNGMYWNRTRIVVGNDAMVLDWIARLMPAAFHHLLVFVPVLSMVLIWFRLVGKAQFAAIVAIIAWLRRR